MSNFNKNIFLHHLKSFSIITALFLITSTDTMATNLRYELDPFSNQLIMTTQDTIYKLDKSIIQKNEEGYVKIKSCTIQDGLIRMELESNIYDFDSQVRQAQIISEEQHHSLLTSNVSGVLNEEENTIDWSVSLWRRMDVKDGKFILKLPSMRIPVTCTLSKTVKSIDEIGQSSKNNNIKVIASAISEGTGTIISLNAFDEKDSLLQTSLFDITVYDRNGISSTPIMKSGRFYSDIPKENISKLQITSFMQQVLPREINTSILQEIGNKTGDTIDDYIKVGLNNLDLQAYGKTKEIVTSLTIPEKGTQTSIHSTIPLEDYKLSILSVLRHIDGTIEIELDSSQSPEIANVSCYIEQTDASKINLLPKAKNKFISAEPIKGSTCHLIIDEVWVTQNAGWLFDDFKVNFNREKVIEKH